MPETYVVSRSITIDAPPARVYPLVADFREWPRWSPWEELDPEMEHLYSGAESGTGAVHEWSGNRKAGRGRMEIVGVQEPSNVAVDLAFEKPFASRSDSTFSIEEAGSGSRVTWTLTGRQTFATRVIGVVSSMDKLLGGDFEKGLARLKAASETPDPT